MELYNSEVYLKRSQLLSHHQLCQVDICYLQETHFDSSESILPKVYEPLLAYFNARVTRLMSRNLKDICSLIVSDLVGRLCVLDVTIKNAAFHLIEVYDSHTNSEFADVF